jgi:hypothetical protein
MPVYHSISDHGPSVVNDDDAQTSPRRTVLSPTIHNSTSLSLPTWTLGTMMTVPRIQTLHSIPFYYLLRFYSLSKLPPSLPAYSCFLFLTFDDINKIDTHLNRNRTASHSESHGWTERIMMRCTNDDDSHTIDESFHKSKSTFLSAVLVLVGTFHPNARSIESSLPSWR